MQECRDRVLFIETVLLRETEDIDAVELVIFAVLDEARDRVDHFRIGGLLQNGKLGLDIAHGATLSGVDHADRQANACHRRVMRNSGERSGWVVTTPSGMTGLVSASSTWNAPISRASASTDSACANGAPTQTRGPAPKGR
ncbi:hypothetical protein ACVWWO_004536 [Bradyrhizobium sp. F1.13.1]